MADRLTTYYDGVDDLCLRLLAQDRSDIAEQLRTAMDGGATSGEILSHTGAVLRQLSDDPNHDIRRSARQLLDECDALWRGAT